MINSVKNIVKVSTQKELDSIQTSCCDIICIDSNEVIEITNRYKHCVRVVGKTKVVIRGRACIKAYGESRVASYYKSSVTAYDKVRVDAWDMSNVDANDEVFVLARDSARVEAYYDSCVLACENSIVDAYDESNVEARDASSVEAWDNSSIVAKDRTSIVARQKARVVATENASVVATENAIVEAYGNVQVVDNLDDGSIMLDGNARIVCVPKTIREFMGFHGIKYNETTATFYKAVRKIDGKLCADYNNDFIYEVGKLATEPNTSDDVFDYCGEGIHIATLEWCLQYGERWNNLAIIEVETKIDNIILTRNSDGMVRTSQVRVIREVPLEECGVFGKLLARTTR